MADRTLKRPMFRTGGSTNEGIMTGLVDRKGYAEGDKVDNQQDWNWMDDSGLGKSLKFAGNLAMDVPSSVIDTALLAPINQAGRFFLGSNPGLSMNKVQESIKKGMFGENAEIYDPNNPDVFYHDEDADPNITEFFGYNTDATPTGIFADKEEVDTTGIVRPGADSEGNKPSDAGEVKTVNPNSAQPVSAADDVKTIYEDLLPLMQSTMGIDDSEMNRQKYLELAKFGANLMSQPGGNLMGAIGKAAADPLEGMTRIAEAKRLGKKKPAEIAMTAAMDIYNKKSNNPTAQKINTYARLSGRPVEEVAQSFLTSTGEEQIAADTIKFVSEGAVKKLGLNEPGAMNYTQQIQKLMKEGLYSIAGKFNTSVPDMEDLGKEEIGNYYVDTNGDLIRWNGKEILYMKDKGFLDKV